MISLFFIFMSVPDSYCGSIAVFLLYRLDLTSVSIYVVKKLIVIFHCLTGDEISFYRQPYRVSYCVRIAFMADFICFKGRSLYNYTVKLFYYFDVFNG